MHTKSSLLAPGKRKKKKKEKHKKKKKYAIKNSRINAWRNHVLFWENVVFFFVFLLAAIFYFVLFSFLD